MNGKIYAYLNRKKYKETGIKTYYIGQTTRTIEERAGGNGCKYMDNPNSKFCRAIKKWGWESFEVEILVENVDNLEELNKLEIEYIEKYDSYYNGYNSTLGGGNLTGYHHTQETKEKISKNRKGKLTGEDNPMYGVIMSEESRRKMSEAKKGLYNGKNHPFYGKHHTEETKQKIRDTKEKNGTTRKGVPQTKEHLENKRKAIIEKQGRPVYCPELDMEFETLSEAKRFLAEEFNCKSGNNISTVCKGKRPYAGKIEINGKIIKLTWQYIEK